MEAKQLNPVELRKAVEQSAADKDKVRNDARARARSREPNGGITTTDMLKGRGGGVGRRCSRCGQFADVLSVINGQFVCGGCKPQDVVQTAAIDRCPTCNQEVIQQRTLPEPDEPRIVTLADPLSG